jgi:hypothetical protein
MSANRKAKDLHSRDALEREAFENLLRELAKIVLKSGRELDEKGLQFLRDGVEEAVTWYGVLQFTADYVAEITLHELEKPLARVIEILKREENVDRVVMALGETKPGYCDVEAGVEHRSALIVDLEKIAAIPPPERRRGAKGNRDLHHLVHRLANQWLLLTGTPFTQMWADNGTPATNGAAFVQAVVRFVDPENLNAVPNMTERVVGDRRRKGVVMPWLNVTSGN